MFLVDSADPDRFEEAENELELLLEIPNLNNVPIAVLFTKQDICVLIYILDYSRWWDFIIKYAFKIYELSRSSFKSV